MNKPRKVLRTASVLMRHKATGEARHASSVPRTSLNPHDTSCLHRLHRFHGLSKILPAHLLLELLLLLVAVSLLQICTRKESPAHPAFMAFIAFMASQACCCRLWGNFAQKTPTERHQVQLLLTFACPINACRILHLHLHLPKQQPAEASHTPPCLHRLHCLHGSHDDRCGKRAGARRGVRDLRSGCSNRVNVA